MAALMVKYMQGGQLKTMSIEDMVFANYNAGVQNPSMPQSFDIALRVGAANGMKEAVFVTADTFFAGVIFQVGEARKSLVDYFQALNDTQDAQLKKLNDVPVLKAVSANVSATYTATVALLTAATKTVTVAVPGVVKDELLLVQPKTLPAGWGYQGAIATADNTVTFSLAVPPLSINGTGTCTFAVFAQRKLVS